MPDQRGGSEHHQQLRAAAAALTEAAVRDLAARFGGRTVHDVRSRALDWPGTNGPGPEPIAALEAARELELAAHAAQLALIQQARQAGRTWLEIGDGLELHWQAVVAKESVADIAYSYAVDFGTTAERQPVTWVCPACDQTITDRGPSGDVPHREEGHGPACQRFAAAVAAWHNPGPAQ